jgi:hypothetical protein
MFVEKKKRMSTSKKTCSALFSETIRKTMKQMGAEKSRPQVIAISAKRTIKEHPGCKRYLERKQERIALDEKHWVVWSSKSFRLHRSKPCSIRVFFSKKAPPTSAWKKHLKQLLQERLGLTARIGKENVGEDNYVEVVITDPKLILSLLNHRVAGFLD